MSKNSPQRLSTAINPTGLLTCSLQFQTEELAPLRDHDGFANRIPVVRGKLEGAVETCLGHALHKDRFGETCQRISRERLDIALDLRC